MVLLSIFFKNNNNNKKEKKYIYIENIAVRNIHFYSDGVVSAFGHTLNLWKRSIAVAMSTFPPLKTIPMRRMP